MAFLVYRYLLPELTVSRSLSLGWVLPVFLRNYLIMLLVAGGLHLYFSLIEVRESYQIPGSRGF